jgi:hypothetical protein
VNWYLSSTVRTSLDFFQTHFDLSAPASTPILRQDEQVLLSRFQLSF